MSGRTKWGGFRTVLCAVDFSDQSRVALQYADAIARRSNATLRVLYVNEPLLVAAAGALGDRQLSKRSAQELRALVDATIAPGLRRGRRLTSSLAIGDPAVEILNCARRTRTDLVVVGTHGLTGARRLLVGSTTLGILQRTTLPILAVPPAVGDSGRALAGWPGARILATVDLDSSVVGQVRTAARIGEWLGTSLLLLHVVKKIAAPAWLTAKLSAHDRIRIAEAQQQLDGVRSIAQRYVETSTRVVCGSVADEIAALAAAERTGLVVTVLRDRGGWFGATQGSISYHVLTHAVTPVLAYPLSWRPRELPRRRR